MAIEIFKKEDLSDLVLLSGTALLGGYFMKLNTKNKWQKRYYEIRGNHLMYWGSELQKKRNVLKGNVVSRPNQCSDLRRVKTCVLNDSAVLVLTFHETMGTIQLKDCETNYDWEKLAAWHSAINDIASMRFADNMNDQSTDDGFLKETDLVSQLSDLHFQNEDDFLDDVNYGDDSDDDVVVYEDDFKKVEHKGIYGLEQALDDFERHDDELGLPRMRPPSPVILDDEYQYQGQQLLNTIRNGQNNDPSSLSTRAGLKRDMKYSPSTISGNHRQHSIPQPTLTTLSSDSDSEDEESRKDTLTQDDGTGFGSANQHLTQTFSQLMEEDKKREIKESKRIEMAQRQEASEGILWSSSADDQESTLAVPQDSSFGLLSVGNVAISAATYLGGDVVDGVMEVVDYTTQTAIASEQVVENTFSAIWRGNFGENSFNQQPPSTPPAPSVASRISTTAPVSDKLTKEQYVTQLASLNSLRDLGVLSPEEYNAKFNKLTGMFID